MSLGFSATAEHLVLAAVRHQFLKQLLNCSNGSAVWLLWPCYYSDNMCYVTDACVYGGKYYRLYDKVKKDCNSWLVSYDCSSLWRRIRLHYMLECR